ncbi:TadG family pilus assembly protein [Methylobacterium sp. 77]|uniref:TadG family pilus assembly protein n=1 Tax=Methylobacterium sp. 77 TaxID=1101192 RepID=UPI00035C180D|nr:TadG family pilus assembly protein [Methylobacterium sp. 77]
MRASTFSTDRRGSVAVFTAFGMTALMAVAAIGVDLGAMVLARRRAQGAVDLAAMIAATNLTNANALARQSLSDNGYAAAQIVVESGTYSGDAKLAAGSRFVAGVAPASAVRVAIQTTTPTYFAPALGFGRDVAIGVKGTAATAQFASFTIGSGLASVDAGIANAILGAMLGRTLSLSVMDYNALLSTRIDAFRFLDALAPTLNLKAGSYSDIIKGSATIGQFTAALQVAAASTGGGSAASSALAQISAALQAGGQTLQISDVVGLGDLAALSPGAGTKGPQISVLDTLSEAVSIANGNRQVSVNLGPSIPGLLKTQITIGIGERKQSSGYVQPNSPQATVNTAQTRILIEASLTLPLGLGSLTLPIYVQAAQAKATLRTVTCPWSDTGRRQISLDALPGLADLAIANIPGNLIDPNAATPDLTGAATILQVTPLLNVSARSRLTLGSPYAQSVSFNDDEITRHTSKTVTSYGMTQSAVTSLIQNMSLSVNGLGLIAPGLLTSTVATALSGVAPALDGVLANTLRTLGLRLGTADLTVDGARCDQAVLVQ